MTASPKPKTLNPIKVNLWVDLGIFVAMLVALAPRFSGIAIHEWLSIALGVTVVIHLLLHWQWLVSVIKRFFSRLPGEARLNFVLNVLLFVDFTIAMFSGIMISREALPFFGITLGDSGAWRSLHTLSSNLCLFIFAFHVALHWKWILSALQRYIANPILNVGRKLITRATPATLPEKS
jgi:predicted ABC-type sugar transport system permease subunit